MYLFEDLTEEQIKRLDKNLWKKVDIKGPDDCWLWTAAASDGRHDQYGKIKIPLSRTKTVRAHRAAFFLHTRMDPGPLVIMHSCDTPKCCNPSHLEPGTHADNMADMRIKGRTVGVKNQVGANNLNAKLSAKQVEKIRNRLSKGHSCCRIAVDYPVTRAAISSIKNNKTWIIT